MSRLDYWGNSKPICPHCRAEFDVWGDDNPCSLDYEDGGHTTFECKSCRKEFVLVTKVEYTFSSAVSNEAADDEIWGPLELPEDTEDDASHMR